MSRARGKRGPKRKCGASSLPESLDAAYRFPGNQEKRVITPEAQPFEWLGLRIEILNPCKFEPFGYRISMALLDDIRAKIAARRYEFSKHAVDQTILRDICVAELEQAVANRSEIIEDYPDDKYWPSCLILGFTDAGRPLHVQCSHPSRPLVKIITVYEPDPAFVDRSQDSKDGLTR